MSTEDKCSFAEQGHAERARALFEEHADQIAQGAVHHLKIHYPAALKGVPKAAELSLRNRIKASIRSRFGPLLSVMDALEHTWEDPDRS